MIRFGVLIVLTVALLSVALRIDSHSSSHSGAPGGGGRASTSPSTPSQVLPTSATRTPSSGGSPSANGGGNGAASGGNGVASGAGPVSAQPQLPATGWPGAVRLSALSLVLIGVGAVSVRAAGPRTRRLR